MRQVTFRDLMQVRQIQQPSISPDGAWVALAAVPDRGDGEVQIYSTETETVYSVPLGAAPVFSADAEWVAMRLEPTFEARETAEGGDAPQPGVAVLSTRTGAVSTWERVRQFAFSGDGEWLAMLLSGPEETDDDVG
ncbi:MAG: hypothetical protein KJN92_10605, partial [Gemmatimonadetes bacterium]|nr:hypothetical protein [Gemmatimonadota bacterium]